MIFSFRNPGQPAVPAPSAPRSATRPPSAPHAIAGVPARLLIRACILGATALAQAVEVGSPPLPTVEYVLEQVVAHADSEKENDAQFAAHYTFVRWKEQSDCDSKGKILETTLKFSTNRPPRLSEASAVSTERTSATASTELHLEKGDRARGRAFEKRDFAVSDELLKKFQFTLTGREFYQDRPVLVLDFVPHPGHQSTHHLKDRFINQAAGRVWIDEATWLLAKADLHLTAPVNVVGGLVGSVKQMQYHFEREITPEGWWYTRAVDWELIGRALINQKHIRYHEGRTNVVKLW